jgi:hypothetical protein
MAGLFLEFTVDEQGKSELGQVVSRETKVAINLDYIQEIQAVGDGAMTRLLIAVNNETGLRTVIVKEPYQTVIDKVSSVER